MRIYIAAQRLKIEKCRIRSMAVCLCEFVYFKCRLTENDSFDISGQSEQTKLLDFIVADVKRAEVFV